MDDDLKDDISSTVDGMIENMKNLRAMMADDGEKRKRLSYAMSKFSDSLDELINISGDLEDSENLNVIVSSLLNKVAELAFNHVDRPFTFLDHALTMVRTYFDLFLAEIDKTKKKKVE